VIIFPTQAQFLWVYTRSIDVLGVLKVATAPSLNGHLNTRQMLCLSQQVLLVYAETAETVGWVSWAQTIAEYILAVSIAVCVVAIAAVTKPR
jgi:hypothetical protein